MSHPLHRLVRTGAALLSAAWVLAYAMPAEAHAFGQRFDLPLPLWLYIGTAAAAVALTFVIMALFQRRARAVDDYPRYNLLANPIGRLLAHPALLLLIRLGAVAVFLLILATGFWGTSNPIRNFSVIMVWVIAWVGLAYVCALLGDLWRLVNPWDILFSWAERIYRRLSGKSSLSRNKPCPIRLNAWPAVILFLIFAWMEIAWTGGATPFNIAAAMTVYSLITWTGMFLYGREDWLRRGEIFSIVFSLFARFAITEVRVAETAMCAACPIFDSRQRRGGCVNCYAGFERAFPDQRQWNLRPPGIGLLTAEAPPASVMVFILVLLASVTYDGFTETAAWQQTGMAVYPHLEPLGGLAVPLIDIAGLIALPVLFIAVYSVFILMVWLLSGRPAPIGRVARIFVYSIVPIAIAYHLSHYISLLLIEGQRLVPLLSDPFGYRWDLFGTAAYRVDIGIIGAEAVWYLSVFAIVLGHVIAVILAHSEALRLCPDHKSALKGQLPLLALMVGYTMISLWIIAQPIVSG